MNSPIIWVALSLLGFNRFSPTHNPDSRTPIHPEIHFTRSAGNFSNRTFSPPNSIKDEFLIQSAPTGKKIDTSLKDSALKIYRATAPKINDLVNTKLDVRFDYEKHHLIGKEWISLKPHFYPTDSLTLDAKGMDIQSVSLLQGNLKKNLSYVNDGNFLSIRLGKSFTANQTYTLYIEYIAKPDEIKQKGSAAITSAKGLYFINSDGKNPQKPIQIWTQGETESSSCWFPTLDKPNQKTTEEISMTVPSKYVTLSNGKLVLQKKNTDGTRTDTWKMDLPHAPYLFMMAVGDFKIYHDHWKNKEVNYYLEPKYAPYAKNIFGNTPEMMSFYAKITGVDFPWNKYSQIVVRDYVSGAMENTTATLHGESVQKTARELLDEDQETTICHELFHQWFGDLVTAESWSNITLNESFATLSEILWTGHQKGKDGEDEERYNKLQSYLGGTQNGLSPSLLRFHYKDREDVFDNVSYPKGSVILYALKNLMGDEAFYAGLQLYLKTNAFKSAEVPQLRLAFEQVTGLDLNPYFNEWYYGEGHPILDINSKYLPGISQIIVNQIQDSSLPAFRMPVKVALYFGDKKIIKSVVFEGRHQIISLNCPQKPDFIDYDVDKIIVGEMNPHYSPEDYRFSYKHAPSFANRMEAVQFCLKDASSTQALELLVAALKDPSPSIRTMVIEGLDLSKPNILAAVEPVLFTMVGNDPKTSVRAVALEKLAETKNLKYLPACEEGIKSPSYSVMGAALMGLIDLDPAKGQKELELMDADSKDHLSGAIGKYYSQKSEDDKSPFFEKIFTSGDQAKIFKIFRYYLAYLAKNTNPAITQNGVHSIVQFLNTLHQSGANENVSAAFKGIAGAKSERASSTFEAQLKANLNQQSSIFNQAAMELLK